MRTSLFFICMLAVCMSFCQENIENLPSFPDYVNQHKDTISFYSRGLNTTKPINSITKEIIYNSERFLDSELIFNEQGVVIEKSGKPSKLYVKNKTSYQIEKIYNLPGNEGEEYRDLNSEGYCLEQEFLYNKKGLLAIYKRYYEDTTYDEILFSYNKKNQLEEKVTKLYHGVSTDSYGGIYLQANPTTVITEKGSYKKGQLQQTTITQVTNAYNANFIQNTEQKIEYDKYNLPVTIYIQDIIEDKDLDKTIQKTHVLRITYNDNKQLAKAVFQNAGESMNTVLQVVYNYSNMGLKHLKILDISNNNSFDEYFISYSDTKTIKTINFRLGNREKGILTYNYY